MDYSGYRQSDPRVVSRAAAAAVGCGKCGMFEPVLCRQLNPSLFWEEQSFNNRRNVHRDVTLVRQSTPLILEAVETVTGFP